MSTIFFAHIKKSWYRFIYHSSLIGIGSLIWFLIRTGTKPSRAVYACQKASLVNASLYLSPAILPLAHKLIRIRKKLPVRVVLQTVCLVTLLCSCFLLIKAFTGKTPTLYAPPASKAMAQHGAIGMRLNTENSTGQSVYATSPQALQLPDPNRVVSVHDSRATNWDYQTGYHWQYIDQEVVDEMVAQGVMALTGRTNIVDAWNDLIPYQPGDEVVIKLNFNNAGCSDSNHMDGYSEPVNAVIDGLVSIGVPPENIWITDPSRIMPPRFIYRIENPDVKFYSRDEGCIGREIPVNYVDSDSLHASVAQCPAGEKIRPAQVFVDAEHLINIPLLKSHENYPTLALKNHYGSVIYRDNTLGSMHAYFEQWGNSGGCDPETENILADINNNPHIRDKTRLVLGDGLFGNQYNNYSPPEKWLIFGNDDPNILFFSADPVAVESVMMEYIVAERGNQDHGYLHAAASLGLGIHDHWDSFENKHFSAIDYQQIGLDNTRSLILAATSGGTTDPVPGTYPYPVDTPVDVSAIPDTGYLFSQWTGDVPPGQEGDNPLTIIMDGNKNITANFVGLGSYMLTIAAGTGGTTDPSPGNHTFSLGSNVSVQSLPSTDYRFSKWAGDVAQSSIFSPAIEFIMDNNKSITATFCSKCGDVNGNLQISPGDAQSAFDIYLLKNANPTECELENADVNGSGTQTIPEVTPGDAQMIFNKYLNKGNLSSDCSGASRSASLSTQTIDFSNVSLTINDIAVSSGQDIFIPIIIESPSEITAFGFDLEFPSNVLTFMGLERTGLTENYDQLDANVLSHQTMNHKTLRVGGYNTDATQIPSSGVLVTLVFRLTGELEDPISLSVKNTYDDIKNATVQHGINYRQNNSLIIEDKRRNKNIKK